MKHSARSPNFNAVQDSLRCWFDPRCTEQRAARKLIEPDSENKRVWYKNPFDPKVDSNYI
jgi:hypothetical protein